MEEEIRSKILDKAHKKLEEDNMGLYARTTVSLFIKDLTQTEYDAFITFIKTKTPNQKGFEAIQILMRTYDQVRQTDALLAYIDELTEKIKVLESAPKEEAKEKPKYIKNKEEI